MTPTELNELRARAGLTQQDIANLLHVSLATVRAWCQGINPMPWASGELLKRLIKEMEDEIVSG